MKPHTILLAAAVCVVAIGGSLPQTAAARQARIVVEHGPPGTVRDGWTAYIVDTPPSTDSGTTWWRNGDDRTLGEHLDAAGVRIPVSLADHPVFLLRSVDGRVVEARVTRRETTLWAGDDPVLHWFGVLSASQSAAFIRQAWEAGGDDGLLYVLGHHGLQPGVEALLTRVAEGNESTDRRKAAIFGLGVVGTESAQRTLMGLIRRSAG